MEEFYKLSPNRTLFECLRNKSDDELSSKVIETPSSVLERVRNHLIGLLLSQEDGNSGTQKMEEFFASLESEDDKVLAYGECILALTAVTEKRQREKLLEILKPFLGVSPSGGLFVRARREWLCILRNELEHTKNSERLTPEQILHLRYVIASWTDNCRPGLVGESFYNLGTAALDAGDAAKARQCFESVRNDMKTSLQAANLPSNLRFEGRGILYWYLRACESLKQMDESLSAPIQREVESIKQKFPRNSATTAFDNYAEPMVGPIARTYLSRKEYLRMLLKEICDAAESNNNIDRDDNLEPVCYRYDYCHEIDDVLFAIERHKFVLPIMPSTVQLSYDPNVQEILDVLKIIGEEEQLLQ